MNASPPDRGNSNGTSYRLSGEGPPIVLVHGVGMDLDMWDPVASRLEAGHRVLRYDMLGHGQSEKPPGPYSLADFVEQVAALTLALHLEAFDLVGFSMGAMVAQAYAAANPGQVRRLVLLSAVYERSPEESAAVRARARNLTRQSYVASIEEAIERWFTPAFRQRNPLAIAWVRRRMQANDLAAYAACYDVFARADRELSGLLPRIAAPTLAMTGAEDRRSTPAMSLALAGKLRRGKSLIVEGRRHLLPLEVPELVASAIEAFLSGVGEMPERVA